MNTLETIKAAYQAKHAEWVAGGRRPSVRNVTDAAGIGRKYLHTNHPDAYAWLLEKTQAADKREKNEHAARRATEQEETIERLRGRVRELEDLVHLLARQVQAEALVAGGWGGP